MRLTFIRDRFEAVCAYDERMVPKEARFRWDPKLKKWWTADVERASALAKYADDSCRDQLARIADQRAQSLAASRAAVARISVRCPEGLAYMPYQLAGIAYAAERPATLLGDEMGTGKTIISLGLINYDLEISRVLVVCPASAKINWAREAEKWLVDDFRIEIINPKATRVMSEGNLEGAGLVQIINYDILHRHPEFAEQQWDLVIGDEIHYCKSAKAKRSKAFYAIKGRRRLFLTGTPILNKVAEIHPIIKALDPGRWGNFMRFALRYCAAHKEWVTSSKEVWNFSGASHLDELQRILRETIMIRRLKKDVLSELPPKFRQVIEFTPSPAARRVIRAEAENYAAVEALEAAAADATADQEQHRSAVEALKAGRSAAFERMSAVRHETALAKVPDVIDHLSGMFAGGAGKIVCFAHHRDVVAQIADAFPGAVTLTGDSSQTERQWAVDTFQNDDSCRLFVGNMKAAGVSLTLTASHHVVFAELDWVPATVTQAEDRCHRIGTTENVLVQHLVFEGSLDATMAKRIIRKQRVIDAALDDAPKPKPAAVPKPKPSERRVRLAREAEQMTPEQVGAVHDALRILAGCCDGARQRDGMGFNGMDTRIGHELADLPRLTPKQAALGRRIALKYHRQLGDEIIARMKVSAPKPGADELRRGAV